MKFVDFTKRANVKNLNECKFFFLAKMCRKVVKRIVFARIRPCFTRETLIQKSSMNKNFMKLRIPFIMRLLIILQVTSIKPRYMDSISLLPFLH